MTIYSADQMDYSRLPGAQICSVTAVANRCSNSSVLLSEQGSHCVLEFKDVLEKSWNLIIWGNVLEKSWNFNILQKCPGNVLEFFSKIHKNVSFLYIKLQIFLGGDTPERPSGCWDPNLAPVKLFGIVNCYYIVNSTANWRGNYVFEFSCMQKSWKMS